MASMIRLCACSMLVVALAACASTGSGSSTAGESRSVEQKLAGKNYRLGEPVERIYDYKLDSWSYLDRKHVIMQTAPSTYYLVALKNSCHGLSSAEVIAFSTTTSQLTRFDHLLVRNAGKMVDRCYIDRMYKLEKVKKAKVGGAKANQA
jgi:hypothetical protein